jgi:uncharacterized protein with ParB-like and HNH nuclease domain
MPKRSPTTKDISLLLQLYKNGQLILAPEFQRNSVWPTPAKAYLIDTILNDRPIPLLFFQRVTSAQSGRPAYHVIDGQQRLRAIFDFVDDRFKLNQSDKKSSFYKKRFSDLPRDLQEQINNYDLVVEELSGYTEADIKDMFVRMNRYVVKLSQQELRHAKHEGQFHEFIERIKEWDHWKSWKIFSQGQVNRMKHAEFVAELSILLLEGPQDKKSAIDLYYGQYKESFHEGKAIEKFLRDYFSWIKRALPTLSVSRYRKPVDFYSLIGALHSLSTKTPLSRINPVESGRRLIEFEEVLKSTPKEKLTGDHIKYLIAASQQTDNILPRNNRISIMTNVITGK